MKSTVFKKIRKALIYIVTFILLVYTGHGLFLYFMQSRFVFNPYKEIRRKPSDMGLAYQQIAFQTSDHVKLSGWFVPSKREKAVILFCHGNAGNVSTRLAFLKIFNSMDLSTFIFDYRGYGLSEGESTEEGVYKDAEAAWHYLTRSLKIPEDKIIVYGRSLGGAVAARLAGKHSPKGLIIDSSFTSITDVAEEMFPIFPIRWFLQYKFPTESYIRQVRVPILIIHSLDDRVIPFYHGEKLYQSANKPKTFLKLIGSHVDSFFVSGDLYINGLKSFIFN